MKREFQISDKHEVFRGNHDKFTPRREVSLKYESKWDVFKAKLKMACLFAFVIGGYIKFRENCPWDNEHSSKDFNFNFSWVSIILKKRPQL